jgi:hypothetical protein
MRPPKGIIDSLLPSSESILGIRNLIGAEKARVYFLIRKWGGGEIGLGNTIDKTVEILPTPHIYSFSQDLRLNEAAGVQQGDIVLKNISKNKYPSESEIETRTDSPDIQKFYVIESRNGERKLYQVVEIEEKYLTWNIHIRRQTTEDQVLRELKPL